MKPTLVFVVVVVVASGCSTTPQWNDRQAYDGRIGEATRDMGIIHASETGGIEAARGAALASANTDLIGLQAIAAKAHLTAEDRAEQEALAKDILDYELLHKEEMDNRWGVGLGLSTLRLILTDPEDIQKLKELSDYWQSKHSTSP